MPAHLLILALLGLGGVDPIGPLARDAVAVRPLAGLEAGATYRATVTLVGVVADATQIRVTLTAPGGVTRTKTLNAGDTDVFWSVRPPAAGDGSITVRADPANPAPVDVRLDWGRRDVESAADRASVEAEPNDSWREAQPIRLGQPVFGSADDVDELDNPDEGKAGLDWFRFVVPDGPPVLAFFQLELLDRDVSANLRVYRPAGDGVGLYDAGKDPTEVIHDRERERYSTHLSRTLDPGTYYLEVNANHPSYVLRTRVEPVPPYADPRRAVDVGLQYLLEAGDAWFAQIPREGNRFSRSTNLHDTAVRCTACHASSFPVEAALVGQEAGYPIRAKQGLLDLTDRLANSPTPLYGGAGLFWQRFIAIPLQAQGEQGSVLLDFARQVDGRDAKPAERFGPFLQTAWRGRWELPMDESNGVVPLDSKFGSAWRDWRVLTAMTGRTGRIAYAQAADAIADLMADPSTDARIETLQDRMHRLHAWSIIDPGAFAPRIAAETAALLALQNPDGGWQELGQAGKPSATYATGQMAWTLMRAGVPRDDPRIARTLAFLLARQQPFGGWFETTTHENFRTPMRETRYALEALALGHPRGEPLRSWSNRDGGPARPPRPGPLAATLADLDNLWDVPDGDRPQLAAAIVPLLDAPDPHARAHAAAALGRLGEPAAVDPLIRALADPSKIAVRAAAWGLRKLGNRGIGVDKIRAALASPDLATRRGAVRIFAQQFPGMDTRGDLADALIALTGDIDLRTRLEALRSLRQWFYRTADADLQRRIVAAYLARMAAPEVPVVRRALREGMYIMLDENLGGGVSLQRTLAILPERVRTRALEGRAAVERDVLLGPILATLEAGNPLQKEALIQSFDGSFFRGRFYARRPTGMIDVGNDREFGFLHEPPAPLLERTFRSLLATSGLPEDARRGAIRLASFFAVAERTADPAIQGAILAALSDPAESVRAAAVVVVGRDLTLAGAEADPARVDLIRRAIGAGDPERRAIVAALGRHAALVAVPAIAADLRALSVDPAAVAGLAPVLRLPPFTAAEVLGAATLALPIATNPADRLAWLDAVLARPDLRGATDPAPALVALVRGSTRDPDGTVRERALEAIAADPRLGSSRAGDAALAAALGDDAPATRLRALALAADRPGFWDRPEARQRLLARLVDPDPAVGARALAIVAQHRLAATDLALAARVKTLAAAPALREPAEAALRAAGLDPVLIVADGSLGRPRLLDLATFRERINPLFTQPGEDGVSCVGCHGNQNVFRVVAPSPAEPGADLAINYQSTLKALNLGDPEASLLFRKPQSPRGSGGSEGVSPTGLTHNGGPRWEPGHPAYAALRSWIGAGTADSTPARLSADGYRPGSAPDRAGDGDLATAWQTETEGAIPGYPHELVADLGTVRPVRGLLAIPRSDRSDGRVAAYEVSLSPNGTTWGEPVARGTWPDDPGFRYVPLVGSARFVRLRGLSEVHGGPTMSLAELVVDDAPAEAPLPAEPRP